MTMHFASFTCDGVSVGLHLLEECSVSRHVLQHQAFYELDFLRRMAALIPPGSWIYDLGAHVGNHTVFFAAVAGLQVCAFEPNPEAFAALRGSIRCNGLQQRVRAFNCALLEDDGPAALQAGADAGCMRAVPAGERGTGQVVAGRSLDSLQREFELQPPAMLKCDIEGGEAAALRGAWTLLQRWRPLIATECHGPEAFEELRELLAPLGYAPAGLFNPTPTVLWTQEADAAVHGEKLLDMVRYALKKAQQASRLHGGLAAREQELQRSQRKEKQARQALRQLEARAARERRMLELRSSEKERLQATSAKAMERNRLLTARLQEKQRRVASLQQTLDGTRPGQASLQQRLQRYKQRAETLAARLDAKQQELRTLKERLARLSSSNTSLAATIQALRGSLSWRLTAPLRWAGALLQTGNPVRPPGPLAAASPPGEVSQKPSAAEAAAQLSPDTSLPDELGEDPRNEPQDMQTEALAPDRAEPPSPHTANGGEEPQQAARAPAAGETGQPPAAADRQQAAALAPALADRELLLVCGVYPGGRRLYGGAFLRSRVQAYAAAGVRVGVVEAAADTPAAGLEWQDGVPCLRLPLEAFAELLPTLCAGGAQFAAHAPHWRVAQALCAEVLPQKLLFWFHGAEVRDYRRLYHNYSLEQRELLGPNLEAAHEARMEVARRVFPHKDIRKIFVSRYLQHVAENDAGVQAQSAHVIHNFIDTQYYAAVQKQAHDAAAVLMLRSFAAANYGTDLAIDAIRLLASRPGFEKLRFTIRGDGPLYAEQAPLVASLPNVDIAPAVLDAEAMRRLHAGHGVFLAPTRHDTQGVGMGEAMASGLVPLTCHVAAVPEFVEPRCGQLCPPDAPEALAEALWDLQQAPGLVSQLSQNAAARVREQCGWEATIGRELALMGLGGGA